MPPQKPPPGRSLADRYPDVAAQWHPTENGDLTPRDVFPGSHRKVRWRCEKGPDHEWQASVAGRSGGKGCPMCAGLAISVTNSLASVYPALALEWHPTKNGNLRPSQVTWGSSRKKVWWKCPKGLDHEWQASVAGRSGGKGCPMCAGLAISVTNSLASLRPDLAAQWHPTLNGELTPDRVVAPSAKSVWWVCDKGPDHIWRASVDHRTSRGQGCPMCAGRAVSVTNSLASLRPDLALEWHPTKNGDFRPDQVVAGSHVRVWWKCPNGPDHEWRASLGRRVSGRGCPMCAGLAISVTNSLASQYPLIAAQWHETGNGSLRPERVAAHTQRQVWWRCPIDPSHVWRSRVSHRTRAQPNGCPHCNVTPRSLAEVRIAYELATLLPLDPDEHRLIVNGRTLDCDLVVHSLRLVIEYDSAYWHHAEDRDRRKTDLLLAAGWRVIRVREEPLSPITELDVLVPLGAPPKLVVDLVLERLAEIGAVTREAARGYRLRSDLVADERSLARIREIQAERTSRPTPAASS